MAIQTIKHTHYLAFAANRHTNVGFQTILVKHRVRAKWVIANIRYNDRPTVIYNPSCGPALQARTLCGYSRRLTRDGGSADRESSFLGIPQDDAGAASSRQQSLCDLDNAAKDRLVVQGFLEQLKFSKGSDTRVLLVLIGFTGMMVCSIHIVSQQSGM